jgi:hypothetical protein
MDLSETFLSPLTQEHCMYFYIVTVIYAITTLFLLIIIPINLQGYRMRRFNVGIYTIVSSFLIYYVSRLQYSVCMKALA